MNTRRFFLELLDDGSFFQSTKPTDIHRLSAGDHLEIYLPVGHRYAQLDTHLKCVSGDGRHTIVPFDRNALGGGLALVKPLCSGPTSLQVRTQSVDSNEMLEGPVDVIIVEPRLSIGDQPLPLDAICLYTVIAQKLGPTDRWLDVLKTAARQKFNVIHFTPIQVLGESRSSYSLSDQLEVSPELCSNGWQGISSTLNTIRTQMHMLCVTDIVLNHTASDSAFLTAHPECAYNEINSPWLNGAIQLDNAIKQFNQRVVRGDFEQSYGVGATIETEVALENVTRAFVKECLDPFKLSSWFAIDQDLCCTKFHERDRSAATPLILANTEEEAYRALLESVGTQRDGVIMESSVSAKLVRNEHELRALLGNVQRRLWIKKDEVYSSIVKGFKETVRYERVQSRKGPVENTPWNSLVPWYFTPIETADKRRLHLANNGWVMGWKATDDFAAAGTLVYLARHLVAWSDCVKLRYGEGPEDCPVLWDRMTKYCELTAEHFDGVRLDNCHSTPKHVGQYLLQRCRRIKSSFFVFAELFTGVFEDDCEFEKVLGLDGLVREAVQTGSPGDLAWHTQKYSRAVRGDLPKLPLTYNFDAQGALPLVPSGCVNLLYDCTHDNETPFQKNRAQDALTCAAFVCASGCAVGSTMGFEILVKHNPTVVANGERYRVNAVKSEPLEESTAEEPRQELIVKYDNDRASGVVLWGSFNRWASGVPMTKVEGRWQCTLSVSVYGPEVVKNRVVGKFVVDGTWQTCSDFPVARDERGNENNVLGEGESLVGSKTDFTASVGMIEARRVLNSVHTRIAEGGFSEIAVEYPSDDFAVVSRHNPDSGEAVYFFIRSYWWKGPDCPACKDVRIQGEIRDTLLSVTMNLQQSAFHTPSVSDNFIRGMSDERSCVVPLRVPGHHYDAGQNATFLNFTHFPSGSVYVVTVDTKSAAAGVRQLMSDAALTEAFQNTTLNSLNAILWSCDAEERDRSAGKRGTYQFPEMPPSVFAGLAGVADALNMARTSSDPYSSGIIKNVMEGDWLIDYHLERLHNVEAPGLVNMLRIAVEKIRRAGDGRSKAVAVDVLFSRLYTMCIKRILHLMSSRLVDTRDPVVHRLALASTHFLGRVNSSTLSPDEPSATLSAGLPFFATEYMREWGRDTMLALPGLCLATGRWEDAKNEILAYAKVIRHGMVPNLLDSGNNPRYNARDAVWFWLEAVQQYCKHAPNGLALLDEPVSLKFKCGLHYEPPAVTNVGQAVHHVLHCHATGIQYREWNAGYRIDSQMKDEGFNVALRCDKDTGFCIGGNKLNCGTWMDKMGSSEKAGNKGMPSSSRDGAPVELTLACISCLKWIVNDLIPNGHFKERSATTEMTYSEWLEKLLANFHSKYYITEEDEKKFPHIAHAGTYKDVLAGMQEDEDYFLRCNYPVGLSFAPDAAPKEHVRHALEVCYKRLVSEPNQVGMKTLDPENYRYRPNYSNSDDSTDRNVAHGWNYHQGPEWVWPLGCWFTARLKVLAADDVAELYQLTRRLANVQNWIRKSPWYSLPEIMDSNGRVCIDGCQSQAWSIGTFLWFFAEAYSLLRSSVWSSTKDTAASDQIDSSHTVTPADTVSTETVGAL